MRAVRHFLFIALAMTGCKRPPMTNTIVAQTNSPNGKSSAVQVERYRHAARASNEFFLIVVPSAQSVNTAIVDENIGDSAILVATAATKVQLRWRGNDTLLVVCDSCGLEAFNIAKKLSRVGSTNIAYQGFPARIAND